MNNEVPDDLDTSFLFINRTKLHQPDKWTEELKMLSCPNALVRDFLIALADSRFKG